MSGNEYIMGREWETYLLPINQDIPVEAEDLVVWGSDSGKAVEWEEGEKPWTRSVDPEDVIYFDYEQTKVDLDRSDYGPSVWGRLTEEWKGHPKGTIAFGVFSHARDGKQTILVEN